ncbi:MAG: prephenate dehydratase [Lawsonibacter sp.]|jgi:chorismate mutase/prephenate dehydratase
MSDELKDLREELDDLDEKLVGLFKARMDVAGRVARYKQEHNLPVLDAGRERLVLKKVGEQAGEELADYAQSLYRTLLSVSRSYQNAEMGGTSAVYQEIQKALATTPNLFPQRPTVACQGIEGAYSQIACDRLFKAPAIMYFQTFDHVFKAVESGMCQYGILPIENSTAGSVKAVYDLMLRHNFFIVRSARLKVSHNLLAKHGVDRSQIREVYSHDQAIQQCADYLAGWKDVKVTVVENTAVASQMVAQSERQDVAALSSRFCAEHYGLNILEENVQDHDNNYTRFICISKKPEIYPGADRTSLMMTLPHRPGSLYHVLAKFYALNINLQKLESRPLPNREFEFMFYFDLEASVYAPEVEKLFRDLEGDSEQLRYLGTYHEVVC